MKKIKTIPALKRSIREIKEMKKTSGFVPTMGYFHRGHLSLIRNAKKDNDIALISVFVNPAQFGENEDFLKYPRDPARDRRMAEDEGADIFFEPAVREMYPEGYRTYIEVDGLSGLLCGKSRPGHFRGVATVVAKLLNIVRPDVLYLGQKDAQQAVILKKMVKDLDFDVKVKVLPTVREDDGLAMSSRNRYLSDEERKAAPLIYRALLEAKTGIEGGCTDPAEISRMAEVIIAGEKKFRIDYVNIVDAANLKPVRKIEGTVLIAVAARLGDTRLIDNILIGADTL